MAALNVPAPVATWDPAGPTADLEKPITVALAPVLYADGQAATQEQAVKLGAFVYRLAGASEEIWNEADQAWQAAPADIAGLAALSPLPLAAKPGAPQPWQGVLVAAGQKDRQGAPRFAKATNGKPLYHLRAYASLQRDGQAWVGLSAPTADWTYVSGADQQRFAIGFDTETARDATRVRLVLRNAAQGTLAYLEMRANGPEVEFANCNASGAVVAKVLLSGAGDIEVTPAPGRKLIVHGDLEVDRIRYQPANGDPRQDL